jgi:hypothetical protein
MARPYKEVYTIIPAATREEKDRWVRIGVAFENNDGSINVFLDALPVNGKLQIRDPKPKEEAEEKPSEKP